MQGLLALYRSHRSGGVDATWTRRGRVGHGQLQKHPLGSIVGDPQKCTDVVTELAGPGGPGAPLKDDFREGGY